MSWIEVSLVVNGELAEAVADVFARFAPNGVATEQGITYVDATDQGTADGPIAVCAYLPVDEQAEERRQQIEDAVQHLRMIRPIPPLKFKPVPDQDWMEAWKQHYRPIPIGDRLLIMPAWYDQQSGDRVAMRIDPGMAFGTGTHPSTHLCLEFLERLVVPPEESGRTFNEARGMRVIDLGCGSGILAISALKLGASTALGVDIDGEAIENARLNARINGIGRELELAQGSLEEIRAGKFNLRAADVVLVNILAPTIVGLLGSGLVDLAVDGGSIILSGILQEQAAGVVEAGEAVGLRLREQRQISDWVALRLEKQHSQ